MTNPHHTRPLERCARTQNIRALLWTLAPAVIVAAPWQTLQRLPGPDWAWMLGLAAALALAGARHSLGQRGWRALATAASAAWVAGTIVEHPYEPARGLVVLSGWVAMLAFLWPAEALRRFDLTRAQGARKGGLLMIAAVAASFGFDAWQLQGQSSLAEPLALSATYAVVAGVALRQRPTSRWGRALVATAACAAALPALGALLTALGLPAPLSPLGLASPSLIAIWASRRLTLKALASAAPIEPGLLDVALIHPSRFLVLSFVLIGALGTLLLGLPLSLREGASLSWLDAAFTAVSATCVTGLGVVDTPGTFGPFGQLALLLLIQVGGLGIMVFSAAAIVLLGKRLSLSHERAAVDLVGATGRAGLKSSIRLVLWVTFATEGAAALLLTLGFWWRGDSLPMAAWRGLFTAISAFCNAGFALQSDSLVSYADSPWTLTVTSLTIIIGGLGPAVIAAALQRRRSEPMPLQARLVLWTTALLLLAPIPLIALLEWDGTLAGLSVTDKLCNAAFQSVTLRTAGFNSIDLAQIRPATWTLMVLLMFVGGSPSSTAGGAKTTTIAVVVLSIVAVVRGRARVELFGRALPGDTVLRATAVTSLAVLGCGAALVALQATQVMPLDVALFEVVSALATVGLTTGGTAALDEVGKIIIIACMFAGRVGPLTLFVFLASNNRASLARRYPEESVLIG